MTALETLIEITIYSTIVFITIMFIKKCLGNKMSPLMQYTLWFIFLLRLIIPVTIESDIHFITFPAETMQNEKATKYGQEEITDFKTHKEYRKEQNLIISEKSEISTGSIKQDNVTVSVQRKKWFTLIRTFPVIWLGGVFICLFYFTTLVMLLKKRISNDNVKPSMHLLWLVEQVKAEFCIKGTLKIVCQYGHGTPALLFPRTLFMPLDTIASLNDEQIKNCIRHEYMHYKRGDQFINILLLLLNAVYWFNPFIWIAFYQIRRDMEMACDSAVVTKMKPSARRDYATLIIGMFSQSKHTQIALGIVQGKAKKFVQQRIIGIFMNNKSKHSVRFIAAMLSLALFVCCFTTIILKLHW